MSKVEEKLLSMITEIADKKDKELALYLSNENYRNEIEYFRKQRDEKNDLIDKKVRQAESDFRELEYNWKVEQSNNQMEVNRKTQELIEKYSK